MKLNFEDLIVFENEDYILINKPANIASLDERNADKSQSILRLAKAYHADAQLGHRLDKGTSGILAIAKNPAAYRHLAMQFEHREVTKRYHAVVDGIHDFEGISVYLPISPIKDGTAVKIDRQKGERSRNHFQYAESVPDAYAGRMYSDYGPDAPDSGSPDVSESAHYQ
jgi:23S rRNA pseudouridine955/2504/2580 synthase